MTQTSKNNVSGLNTDVTMQMGMLRDDIAALTDTVADYGKAHGALLKASASDGVANFAEQGATTANALKAKAEKRYSETEAAVRANPAAAVGIAATLGFLVGILSARR